MGEPDTAGKSTGLTPYQMSVRAIQEDRCQPRLELFSFCCGWQLRGPPAGLCLWTQASLCGGQSDLRGSHALEEVRSVREASAGSLGASLSPPPTAFGFLFTAVCVGDHGLAACRREQSCGKACVCPLARVYRGEKPCDLLLN